jgi:hypothetical protein
MPSRRSRRRELELVADCLMSLLDRLVDGVEFSESEVRRLVNWCVSGVLCANGVGVYITRLEGTMLEGFIHVPVEGLVLYVSARRNEGSGLMRVRVERYGLIDSLSLNKWSGVSDNAG